eukprot:CAMPEP_0177774958 /NCGR_PEP_ID=MMETSP0491_2-20121128/13818_1 /TAXON_ID=63592 /ORGANISM="Tetraselmis chuii, Strain PLY429" /LENGTH=203 /DNA_ID=CAMNT_0019293439 /DNA_START=91 /DNA_END=702 /DNA_ORIENTATION=+
MTACLPTIALLWNHGQRMDLAACAVAFAVACCYHACHVDPRGFVQSDFLGLPSYTWRTVDILCAQFLLGRTFGQAIGAKGALLQGIHAVGFPSVAIYQLMTKSGVSLAQLGKCLLGFMLVTLAAKLSTQGTAAFPSYSRAALARIVACFVLAFAVFPLPAHIPGTYWLFHSLWHVFGGMAYHELYSHLLCDSVLTTNLSEKRA